MSEVFPVGTFNAEGARKPDLDVFLAHKPKVILGAECYWAKRYAKKWGKRNGYKVTRKSARFGWEARSVMTLVRDSKPKRDGVMKMKKNWWWGPSRDRLRKRSPRRFLRQVLESNEGVLVVHQVPGGPKGAQARTGGKNKKAWHEGKRRINRKTCRWDKKGRTWVAGPDFNATKREVRKHFNGKYTPVAKVDGVLHSRDLKAKKVHHFDNKGHGWGVVEFVRV